MRSFSELKLLVAAVVVMVPTLLAQGPRPRVEWVFEKANVLGDFLRSTRGKEPVKITGGMEFHKGRHWEAGAFIGSRDLRAEMEYKPGNPSLPTGSLTVEAWVNLDSAGHWGGLVSALQDNGGFEQGWLLGYYKSRFCLALASTGSNDGDGMMTYLTSDRPLTTKRWHHVVGTYNGKIMRIFVDGVLAKESDAQSGKILYPKQTWFALGTYRDNDENYPMSGLMRSAAIWSKALSSAQVKRRYIAQRPPPLIIREPLAGPVVRHLSDGSVAITWRTERAEPTAIWTGLNSGQYKRVAKAGKRRDHRLLLQAVASETEHEFQIEFAKRNNRSRTYQFDSTFDYANSPQSKLPRIEESSVSRLCVANLKDTPTAGFILVIGAGDGEVALEMARTSHLQVVVAEPNPELARRLRIRASQESLYGTHLSVQNCDLSGIRMPRWFANVICFPNGLGDEVASISAADVLRCLRPDGGVVVASAATVSADAWLSQLAALVGVSSTLETEGQAIGVCRIRRPALKGTDSWTHQYANPSHTAATMDEVVKGDMELLWYGPPGPRPMLDRGARTPAPVADNGRLFIQGNRILFGLDAFNGTILWSAHFPGLRRVNIPRDGSNMVVDGDVLLIAEGPVCRRIDAATGEVIADLKIPNASRGGGRHWGFLALSNGRVFGSTTKPSAAYTGAEGQWYDGGGAESYKVTSDCLFAMEPETGKVEWQYRKRSVIVNSTIIVHDSRVFFLESRNPDALKHESGRIGAAIEKDTFFVALSAKSGREFWRHKIDISQSERTVYLSAADGVLLLSTSKARYSHRAFSASSGKLLWSTNSSWKRNHHGGTIQHPVITEGIVYVGGAALDLKTGKITRTDFPARRGCGTMSASKGAIFYRHHSHGLWDLATNKKTEYVGIRSGCWLGMIPSEGLLLLPEASSGCSCAKDPIQISMALAPVEVRGN